MNLLTELESMAINASLDNESVPEEIAARWKRLFGFTKTEAIHQIEKYRSDYARIRISDELWATVQVSKEAQGFDREAYEYSLVCRQPSCTVRPRAQEISGTYIVKLEGPLASAETIQEAAALSATPTVVTGTGDSDVPTIFCEIDGKTRAKVLDWISRYHPGFQPTIVRLAKAKKDLCAHSLTPTLGLDATLPQNLFSHDMDVPLPSQDQFPVWYFFYGTLADPKVLTQHLGLKSPPNLISACVYGGQIQTWGGKYKALVDAPGSTVSGKAFLVQDREQEDGLRFYETDKYEVVRCQIATGDGMLPGLTFRFSGTRQEMD